MTVRKFHRHLYTAVLLAAGLVACGGSNSPSASSSPNASPAPPSGGDELVEESYATLLECDTKITTRDGTVLSANIRRPDAPGQFPVLLTTTPYGKDVVEGGGGAATATDPPDASEGCLSPGSPETIGLAEFGYVVISVDWRGTGKSGPGDW